MKTYFIVFLAVAISALAAVKLKLYHANEFVERSQPTMNPCVCTNRSGWAGFVMVRELKREEIGKLKVVEPHHFTPDGMEIMVNYGRQYLKEGQAINTNQYGECFCGGKFVFVDLGKHDCVRITNEELWRCCDCGGVYSKTNITTYMECDIMAKAESEVGK